MNFRKNYKRPLIPPFGSFPNVHPSRLFDPSQSPERVNPPTHPMNWGLGRWMFCTVQFRFLDSDPLFRNSQNDIAHGQIGFSNIQNKYSFFMFVMEESKARKSQGLEARNCVTSAPLLLCRSLSSTIFPELVRHRCHPTKSLLFPIYTGIQALCWPCTTNTKQYQLILTKY